MPMTTIPMERGETITGPTDLGFGAAVAISSTLMAVGAPNIDDTGYTFNYLDNDGSWDLTERVGGRGVGSEFGFSIDMNGKNTMIVGSPGTKPRGKESDTGFAYFYNYDTVSATWGTGLEFSSGLTSDKIGERFGEAVALSSTGTRAAVGAPGYGGGAGRVYMLELDGGQWSQMGEQVLQGSSSTTSLGSSVDMSDDGRIVVAGSPGEGGFDIYEFFEGQWALALRESAPSASGLGESVAVLSNEYIAVSSPSARGNRGTVSIYRKSNGSWSLYDTINGDANQKIGGRGLLTGTVSPDGEPEITFGTATGQIIRYDYIGGDLGERFQRFAIDTDFDDLSSLAIDKESATARVWVGSSSAGEVREFRQVMTPQPTKRLSQAPTPRPTSAPTRTLSPTTETKMPTLSPTPRPTGIPDGAGWRVFSGPFTGPIEGTEYGAAVAMDGNAAAAGSPNYSDGIGSVQTFEKIDGSWRSLNTVYDTEAQDFGQSVDISVGTEWTSLAVGAPGTFHPDSPDLRFGSAYYLEKRGSRWSPVGGTLRPEANERTSSGQFGAAVAVAPDTRRIAVGAPRSNPDTSNLRNGQVYTYEYNGNAFVPMASPLNGDQPGDLFGSALDMTKDGTRLLVGAPGDSSSLGSVYYYEWQGNQWNSIFSLPGSAESDNLGTSVAILASNGETIAVGAPNFNGGQGQVKVFRRTNGFWNQLGRDIVGLANERLGSTLSGFGNRVVVGTATGSFKVYAYNNGSNAWTQVEAGTQPDTGSAVVSIATGSEQDVLVGLNNEDVAFYGVF